MSNKVEMLAVVCPTKQKGKLEVIAFCDGVRPAGSRSIKEVTLQETRCLSRKVPWQENIMLSAWFNQYDKSVPSSQQALVALLETNALSLSDGLEVTPLGHAAMKFDSGVPVHLPTASISTKKKLCAMHWDQMRGLLRQYEVHKEAMAQADAEGEVVEVDVSEAPEAVKAVAEEVSS